MEKHKGVAAPETRDFSLKPVSPENLAEAVRQEVAAMMGIGADKISVTVADSEIHIAYDAGVAEIAEFEMEVE